MDGVWEKFLIVTLPLFFKMHVIHRIERSKMKKSFVFVLTVAFMFSFFSCSKVKDGIYTGTSAGMQGPVEVKLTVAKGKIAGVEITKNR